MLPLAAPARRWPGPLAGRLTPGPLTTRAELPPKRAAARVLGDYPARPEADGQVAGE